MNVPPNVDPKTGELLTDPELDPNVEPDPNVELEDEPAERADRERSSAGDATPAPSTDPAAKADSDPHDPPPSAAPDAEPNFVILAGAKPRENALVSVSEVFRVTARTQDDAKRIAEKDPRVANAARQGGVVLAAVSARQWKPELVEQDEPTAPPLKRTAL